MDIVEELGPSVVARMVGCKVPSVSEWRGRKVPEGRCPAIERGTNGKYACEVVRPDLIWVRVPDPDWPWHPQGRPLLDVAAMNPPAQKAA